MFSRGPKRVFTRALGGALRRNMLLNLAEAYLFNPKWSLRILDETQKAFFEITKGENECIHEALN